MKLTIRLLFALLLIASVTYAQNAGKNELNVFVSKTGAIPTIDKATSSVSSLRFPAGNPMKLAGGTAQEKALSFVGQNAKIFDLQSGRDSYRVINTRKDGYGLEHVALQQYVNGVPVFDGVLKFHFTKSNNLASLNGNSIKVEKLNTRPTISSEEANSLAIKMVLSQKTAGFKAPPASPLKVNKSTLYVFQKGLAQGYEGQKHLVYEVEVRNDNDVREFLYIDAHSKQLVEQFAGMHQALNRELRTYPPGSNENTVPTVTWVEGQVFPGALDKWQQSEIASAGQMYHMMKNAFGFVSYDGNDAKMITTHNNPSIRCPNASWNGTSANYCVGTATDDVVAHEWGHAYTEYTSGLIYAWQAGALNEAYSDIWGETVDLLNNYLDEGEGTAMRNVNGNDCPTLSASSRWRVGEQSTSFGGALRDMYNPNCFGDPGRVLDPLYYCTSGQPTSSNDAGGVHINSGVINHAYALLVDGGIYNGQTITGIGLTKAAHIFWYAQAHFMGKTTDFAAQADILEAAAQALITANVNLPNLSTEDVGPTSSGQFISVADLEQLQKVLLAVEMRAENTCGYAPLLQPLVANCLGSNTPLFYYDFESGMGQWTVLSTPVNSATWFPRTWVLNNAAPGGHTGNVLSGLSYLGGNCGSDDESGVMSVLSPVMAIPGGAPTDLTLAFDHYISLESGYDGGNVRYKIGAGAWTLVPASAFIGNGYNQTLSVSENTNPLAGQHAFSGADEGSVSGTWGQSRINLAALGMAPGQSVQFRWDLGSDGCNGWDGWYLDNVRMYSCAGPTVQFVTANTVLNEAEAVTPGSGVTDCLPYVEKIVQVKINQAPTAPVTVTFNTPTGTATLGETADYTFSPASVILQEGVLVQDVMVRIYNDAYVEGAETVVLSYTLSGGNGIPELLNQTHTITINDNDFIPGTPAVTILSEDFSGGLPAGWIGGGTYPDEWAAVQTTSGNSYVLDLNNRPFLFANSDERGQAGGLHTFSIETAPFSTLGYRNLDLSFLEYFYVYPSGYPEVATVEVWDGTTWHIILTQNQASGSSGGWAGSARQRNLVIPTAYASAATKLRFRYTAEWDQWWAIDKIRIVGTNAVQISTIVTATPDEQYLGPLATAYFYDPTTKNLIAKIENLTTHDYGCTKVEIDRAGDGSAPWVAAYTITQKTVKITPTNPNLVGEYNITLYYTDDELGLYQESITSMGKSEDGITENNAAIGSFAEVQVSSAYSTDWAYTAKFTSGFSGFGLSNAPPIGSLPVTLVKFEGKHSTEGNQLKWVTTAEENSDYFAVERATDVKNFSEIGRVAGHGNSAITNNYTFTDGKYVKGFNYYRLRSVDKDGSYAYSKIVGIDAKNLRDTKFYPNPVQSVLKIELPDVDMDKVTVKVKNVSGQVIIEKNNVKTTKGIITQDVSKLSSGVYQVVISDDRSSYNFSVVKL
jgi:Zn-dependent metalloprotease